MSAAADILKNFNLYVDGRGFAGNVETAQLPNLALVIEDFRAGGLDSPIPLDMGMEPMEASFTLSQFSKETLALWGVGETADVPLTFRGALESQDGTVRAVVVNIRGRVTAVNPSEWAAGSKANIAFTVRALYYKYTQDGTVVHEIDVVNMVRKINGVDRLAAIRQAINGGA